MYQYNKEQLPNLFAEGDNESLIFKTSTEEATVTLSPDGRISKVIHRDHLKGEVFQKSPQEAHHIVVGTENCQRDVYHYLLPSPHPHLQIRLGQTIHRGESTWSSLPHNFENHPEPGFEEIFYYLLCGGNQKAVQIGRGLWADGSLVDSVWSVQDRSFSVIPMGYHPIVGEPGVKVSYIWAYLAKKKEWEKIKI